MNVNRRPVPVWVGGDDVALINVPSSWPARVVLIRRPLGGGRGPQHPEGSLRLESPGCGHGVNGRGRRRVHATLFSDTMCTMTGPSIASARAVFDSLLPGVWRATTDSAPYPDHLFTVFPTGTFLITNPTNVEQGADLSGINDSVGMGLWRQVRGWLGESSVFELQFWQLNAHADTHLPAPDLTVGIRVFIDPQHPDRFTGSAVAVFGDGSDQPTGIVGTRRHIDDALMARVPR